MHLSISNDIVSTKIYDKRDDFDFEIVKIPFLDGDVPRSTSYGVYISQLIRFARASSYVADFNTRNKLLTQKLLKQGYRYHKLRKTFSKFYRRYYDLISKFQVGLKSLLRQGLSEPDFYGDLVYKLKKIVGSNNFSAQFIKIISHYKKIGYNINVLQQTACLVVNPITVGNFAFLFNCTPVGRTSDSMMVPKSIQSSTTPDPGYQWESDKLTEDTTNESQEVSPFPAGDHKATRNRHLSKTHTNMKHNSEKTIHKRSTALERSVKNTFTGGLKPV